jgi:hypothetical protein
MNIWPEDETSDTAQYQDPFQKNLEDGYSAKHRCLPVYKPESIPRNNL